MEHKYELIGEYIGQSVYFNESELEIVLEKDFKWLVEPSPQDWLGMYRIGFLDELNKKYDLGE